ncbi:MAG: hypothetical protein ACUVRZ_08985 [Desulfobacca sp.]|uniref:hypothetical protein n=1 Tax=Desulfobacca sp. TaxID=2067990 RepID=UPI0040491006
MESRAFFAAVRLANNATLAEIQRGEATIRDRHTLKEFLEYIHIKKGLLEAYDADYPLIEPRELLPSFESNYAEYRLPNFSMVAFNRPLYYQREVFQFDLLHSLGEAAPEKPGGRHRRLPTRERLRKENAEKFLPHLTKELRAAFKEKFLQQDLTSLACYEDLLPFLFHMDRAHVIAKDGQEEFRLLGCYASFPSDLDTELKQFGRRLGKFNVQDETSYERHRTFVYQFLMELYGFPISSERRTSSALFARKLSRLKDSYLIKVLGASDRVITSLNGFDQKAFPVVEKAALVAVPADLKEMHSYLTDHGFYLDAARRVVLVKVTYMQHRYHRHNVQEDRALSVVRQEIIHPHTGERASFNILKDTKSFLVTLNDIIRGEHVGRIAYRQEGLITSTKGHDDRLKFLYAWLTKNQRRFTSYSKEFFTELKKILHTYILNPEYQVSFRKHAELHREVLGKIAYLQQLYEVQQLERLLRRRPPYNQRLTTERFLALALEFVEDNYDDILHYYDDIFDKCNALLNLLASQPYLKGIGQQAEPPANPYQRTLWLMLIRLRSYQETLARDRARIKKAEEEGAFTHLLLREPFSKPPAES